MQLNRQIKITLYQALALLMVILASGVSLGGEGVAVRDLIMQESELRSAYLQQKFSHWTPIQRQARIEELALGNRVLRENGVPRQYISEALQSFEPGTIKGMIADESTYGLRFYGGTSRPKAPYLNPTFPLGNVRELNALPPTNELTNIIQWQVKPDTSYLYGRVRFNFGQSGGGVQMYIPNPESNLIQPKW